MKWTEGLDGDENFDSKFADQVMITNDNEGEKEEKSSDSNEFGALEEDGSDTGDNYEEVEADREDQGRERER